MDYANLRGLDLNVNNLVTLYDDSFDGLENLKSIGLVSNKFKFLISSNMPFSKLKNLENLDLIGNDLSDTSGANSFKNLNNSNTIYLRYANVKSLSEVKKF